MSALFKYFALQKYKILAVCALLYLLTLLSLTLLQLIAPQRNGIFALIAIFAPYCFLPTLLLLPFIWRKGTSFLRLTLLALVILFVLRFPLHFSFSSSNPNTASSSSTLTALSWNVFVDAERVGVDFLREVLDTKKPAIVALQEAYDVNIEQATDILARYPYHLSSANADVPNESILLSTYPILEYGVVKLSDRSLWSPPEVLWARLDLGKGQTLMVFNTHLDKPLFPRRSTLFRGSCPIYCPDQRDTQIKTLNAYLQPLIKRGEHILVMGDMNTTDREAGYSDLSAGLRDTHLAVGNGSGHSWGLIRAGRLWPLIRIDYMFITPNVQPLSFDTDCTFRGSDHCMIVGRFSTG